MAGPLSGLAGHWFAPAPATRLATLRVLLGGYGLWYVGRRVGMYRRIARTNRRLYLPVGAARLNPRPVPQPVFDAALVATLAANTAVVVGWRYPITGPIYGGLLLWLLSYRNSWTMIFHSDNVLVFHALILGCAPAADALALDARRGGALPRTLLAGPDRNPAGDWHYGWPIRLMNAVTAATYLLAGVAKLAGPSGRQWATGDGLRSQIATDALRKELLGTAPPPYLQAVYRQVALLRVLAIGSLVLEALAPLFLVDRRLARFWAVNAFLMHWGIFGIMKIRFRYQLSGVIYAPLFDVERPVAWLAERVVPRDR